MRNEQNHTDRRTDAEPTASADWRTEYAANGAVLPDGGREILPNAGSRVADREDDDAELIVVDVHPDARADSWVIDATGDTVAAHNPGYRPDSAVVEAVYAEDTARLPSWRTVEDLRDAVDDGALTTYTFPVDRLAVRGGGS
jgi:hypothetical protein